MAKVWQQLSIHQQKNRSIKCEIDIDHGIVLKSKNILPLETTQMNMEGFTLSDISPTKEDKYSIASHM